MNGAFRIAPHPQARTVARDYAPGAHNRWEAMLLGYQQMPTEVLLVMQPVQLITPVAELISKAGRRIHCDHCGEEVVNEREIMRGGRSLCRACAGLAYYQTRQLTI